MIQVQDKSFTPTEVIELLSPFLTAERLAKIDRVAQERILGVVPVLENIYDRGNVSAVMRTGEALGVARFVVIESKEQRFKAANRVTQGADKWLDVKKFDSAAAAVKGLRTQGFQVWATALSAKAVSMEQAPFEKKMAFILGNEKEGVSKEALDLCDGNFLIPMRGFSQSFNISVAGALILQHATRRQLESGVWADSAAAPERELLRARYMMNSLGSAEKILLNY